MPRLAATPGLRDGCPANRHDTASAYRWGCRCPAARDAHRVYYKRRRHGRQPAASIDATGTIRRIEALQAIGWRLQDIARHLGDTWQSVAAIRQAGRVYRSTARRIATVYDALWERPGPSAEARRRALARGFASPLAWFDADGRETIDDPAADPIFDAPPPPPKSRVELRAEAAERRARVARLTRAGHTIDQIAVAVGLSAKSVTRHQQAIRAATAAQLADEAAA